MIPAYAAFADVLLRAEAAASASTAEIDVATLIGRLPSFDSGKARKSALDVVRDEIAATRRALHLDIESGRSMFARVVGRAGLTTIAAEVLAIVAAVDAHLERQRLVATLNADASLFRVTLGVIERMLGSDGVGVLATNGPLLSTGLISVTINGTWARAEIGVAPELTFALQSGQPPMPPRGARFTEFAPGTTTATLVLVPAKDSTRGRRIASEALGGRLVIASSPTDPTGWSELVRAATVDDRDIVIDLADELSIDGRETIERAAHLRWALVSQADLPIHQLPERPWIELPATDTSATADELAEAFGADSPIAHRLTSHQAHLAGRAYDGVDPDRAVRRLASGELDRLAARVRPARGWSDLVLPDEQLTLVKTVVERYHHRGDVYERWGFRPSPSAGVVAMFSGPPGTGKTLSAEVVAKEIGLDMYRIDLSALVSKYIGETEKNLDKVFRAAEGGTMVLLFDEADAVFGKRSEVSDANDRYANVETSYLLQRIESYDGVVILTTNYASNIDSAFMRRIHVSVEFTPPDEQERLRLWAQSFPPGAPLGELDLPLLARRFKLSGSAIRSVALGAAFRAAAASGPIGMETIAEALRSELRKQGRVATSGDLLADPDTVLSARTGRRP